MRSQSNLSLLVMALIVVTAAILVAVFWNPIAKFVLIVLALWVAYRLVLRAWTQQKARI